MLEDRYPSTGAHALAPAGAAVMAAQRDVAPTSLDRSCELSPFGGSIAPRAIRKNASLPAG